jgi:diguanylate cyclase (GGDEF)-like protein
MTIFQKMLLVPILSLLLYASFSIYSYSEQQKNSTNIEVIKHSFTPASVLIVNTSALFNELRDILKDSVIAGESDWLKPAEDIHSNILINLNKLKEFKAIVDQDNLELLIENLSLYYVSTLKFSRKMLSDKNALMTEGDLIQDIELYYNNTQSLFFTLIKELEERFKLTINQTSQSLNNLLLFSIVISLSTMIFIFIIMLMVAVSTRKGLNQLIVIVKDMALGSSDFSQRISRKSSDELGSLIYWFNKLADKLEQDYVNLETISITDKLTQLNNRTRTDAYFPLAINEAHQQHEDLAAVLVDIDHFKSVNDGYGHLVGDKILQSMAALLKENTREHDFIARWGGEEFIILLPKTQLKDAFKHIDNLRSIIEFHIFPDVKSITASFGISMLRENDTPETLMERADKCLYEAKEQGRNRVITDT